MKKETNDKLIIFGLCVVLMGILLVLIDIFWIRTDNSVYINVGCSLLASGFVLLGQGYFIDRKEVKDIDEWGLEKVYKNRSDKNNESDPRLHLVKDHLDGIAFGLKAFRSTNTKTIERLLSNGVNVRILTMNPDENNLFLTQREVEENDSKGQLLKDIKDLVEWANKLNSKKYKGHIHIKGYTCMTLDFYWRVDDELYVGPYLVGMPSSKMITYKYTKDKKGFELFTEYFEKLWDDKNITVDLTDRVHRYKRK